ncbi:MAG: hypothetical protein ACRD1T_01145 [Acidimicrobiia bacterium]
MPEDAVHRAADLLQGVSLEHVQDFLAAWNDVELDDCARESNETSTHFQWRVHRGPEDGYEIWLHEYKPQGLLRSGYADSIHDHRYWFASSLLAGGFTQTTYCVEESTGVRRLRETGKVSFTKGTAYVVDPSAVHSISDFSYPTLTLLVRSRAIKPYSTEFRLSDGRAVHYYPLRTRIRLLRDRGFDLDDNARKAER